MTTTNQPPPNQPTADYAGGLLGRKWKAASTEAARLKALSRFYTELKSTGTGTVTDERIAMETLVTAMEGITGNGWKELNEKEPKMF
jgi:hypothetical protein